MKLDQFILQTKLFRILLDQNFDDQPTERPISLTIELHCDQSKPMTLKLWNILIKNFVSTKKLEDKCKCRESYYSQLNSLWSDVIGSLTRTVRMEIFKYCIHLVRVKSCANKSPRCEVGGALFIAKWWAKNLSIKVILGLELLVQMARLVK